MGSIIPWGNWGAEQTSMAVFLLMALFIALKENNNNMRWRISKNSSLLAHTVCILYSYLHIYFHSFLVKGNVNELHPKVVCGFVKGCMDTDRCKAAEVRTKHKNNVRTYALEHLDKPWHWPMSWSAHLTFQGIWRLVPRPCLCMPCRPSVCSQFPLK